MWTPSVANFFRSAAFFGRDRLHQRVDVGVHPVLVDEPAPAPRRSLRPGHGQSSPIRTAGPRPVGPTTVGSTSGWWSAR